MWRFILSSSLIGLIIVQVADAQGPYPDTLWYKDVWNAGEVVVDVCPEADSDLTYLQITGDTVGLELANWAQSIFLTKAQIPVDLANRNVCIEYRMMFRFDSDGSSHATINVVFNPPETTNTAWWQEPVYDACWGQIDAPADSNYLCAFGPNSNL